MMATNSERQAAYRARHLKSENGELERLNLMVNLHAKRSLERLASCYGVTQRAMIERLLQSAERAAVDAAQNLPDGQSDYYDSKLKLGVTQ
ncbi:MAG: hypothetical protein HHJ17_17770 [Rhodoferax sp.]|nr:hypothetical protein [Rhodoferax sp.]